MFFLNLTAGEFLTLLGALSGLITTLYLLDRTRRKKVVSTLRFWNPAFAAEQQQSRKRVREPWSLLLQLLSLLLLLLAIAQLQWGMREGRGRDHVLLLDTSSWSGQTDSDGTVLDREKAAAQQYLAALPARDRVMLVRADALSAPATTFTANRQQLSQAIRESVPAFSALNIAQALSFAQQARDWSGGQAGEVVYVGPKLVDDIPTLKPDRLRVITVPVSRDNAGLRSIAVTRGDAEANSWQATVTLKNYGSTVRLIQLRAEFAGTVFAPRALTLRPGQETAALYTFVTNTKGRFTAAIEPHDRLPADDQASLELPGSGLLEVAAFSSRPEVLKPLLEANRRLSVKFFPPAAYISKPAADIMLLDRFAPPQGRANEPKQPSLWIEPPRENSPLPIKSIVDGAAIKAWHSDASLGSGLHAKEARIPRAEVFETFAGDEPVASISEGPVVVVRAASEARRKQAVIGFDPLSGPMRFEVTTPLLFANLLRWLSPEAFRTLEITAGRVGTANITLDKGENPASLHVTDEKGFAVPFTIRDQGLELFASRPSIVRILSEERDRVVSLTLPDVAEIAWNPAGGVSTGMPSMRSFGSTSTDMWQWLALAGGLGLLCEWLLFAQRPLWAARKNSARAARGPVSQTRPERKPELVSR